MAGGRLFNARDAASGKARSPRVDLCTDGTTSVMVVDERRWRRRSTSAVRRTLSATETGNDVFVLYCANACCSRRDWRSASTMPSACCGTTRSCRRPQAPCVNVRRRCRRGRRDSRPRLPSRRRKHRDRGTDRRRRHRLAVPPPMVRSSLSAVC